MTVRAEHGEQVADADEAGGKPPPRARDGIDEMTDGRLAQVVRYELHVQAERVGRLRAGGDAAIG